MMNRLKTFMRPLCSAFLLATLCSIAGAQEQSGAQNSLSHRTVALFAAPPTGKQYQLRLGDVLSLRVFQHPEFSSDDLRINERGMISLPVVGEVEAAGRTVLELHSEVTLRYRKYENNPQVSLRPSEVQDKPVVVYAEHDMTGREVRVSITPMRFDEVKLTLREVSYTGGDEVVFLFAPVKMDQTYELTAWLNGIERVILNSATKQSQTLYNMHGTYTELMMRVPLKSLALMTNAMDVKMRLGEREFKLKEQDLAAIRFMVQHISKVYAP